VDLSEISGTGRKGRILEEDVRAFVKERLEGGASGEPAPAVPAEAPAVDFGRFGETEVRALSRIKRLSGPHLHRSWSQVPHVTHHDEADVTALEAFRQSLKREALDAGVRITFLTFALKALARAVREFPDFNASLSPDGRNLVLKKYVNIGVAVDTPNGLVVPVVRAVETKGIFGLARELGDLGARARENRLRPADLEGGSITVSSLGGIGGTAFTPIVNAPEVAILGLARSRTAPMWDGSTFQPRLMQPLDLSYDHRVIDGAQAARFVRRLSELLLEDPQRLLL
jgi:pyruvate dehydrogenase E2 component (dihydrolipoamide acetyltransferase)